MDLLAQGERTVENLARAAGMGLSTVSAHLQVLKLSNLVRARREGTRVYYRLAGDDVAALFEAMLTIARTRSADVERALNAYLNLPGSEEVGVITRQELADLLDDGDARVLDVRPREEYVAGHIPGAQSLPFEELSAVVEQLRDERRIIAYCRGASCVLAHDAVRLLGGEGIEALRLEDGMLEWRTPGHPVEIGA